MRLLKERNEVNILGIGPLLALVGVGTFAIVVAIQRALGYEIPLASPWREMLRVLGVVLSATGVYFWLSSALLVKRAFQSHRLETTGVYRLCRNPLYAAFIVFIVPGLSFLLNDLLLLTASIMMFVAFKLRIGKEEDFLLKEFGADYQRYAREVAQLIPFVKL
jgi:protein-S-isoprenylcysteine O-methyltransferase Ste14